MVFAYFNPQFAPASFHPTQHCGHNVLCSLSASLFISRGVHCSKHLIRIQLGLPNLGDLYFHPTGEEVERVFKNQEVTWLHNR